MAIIKSRIAAAEALGVTERTIGRWKKLEGFPDCSQGYDIDLIRGWVEDQGVKGSDEEGQKLSVRERHQYEKMLGEIKKNRLLDIEIAKAEKKLMPREEIHDIFMDFATLFRGTISTLQQGGHDAAAKIVRGQVERMRKLVHDRLGGAESDDR